MKTISAGSCTGLAYSQHKLGHLTTVQKEDLRNHVDPHTAPIPLSL